jgi:hypothetical protein
VTDHEPRDYYQSLRPRVQVIPWADSDSRKRLNRRGTKTFRVGLTPDDMVYGEDT